MAEIEKIWILNDKTNTDCLSFNEFETYVLDHPIKGINLSNEEISTIFDKIDANKDSKIDKSEMFYFLEALLNLNIES